VATTTNFVNKFHDNKLQDLVKRLDLVDTCAKIVEGAVLLNGDEHHERISLARGILDGESQ
jgi:hypothetical protein